MMRGDGAAAARKVRKWNWLASQQAREKIQPLQCGCEGAAGWYCAFCIHWFGDCMLMSKATQNSALQLHVGFSGRLAQHRTATSGKMTALYKSATQFVHLIWNSGLPGCDVSSLG